MIYEISLLSSLCVLTGWQHVRADRRLRRLQAKSLRAAKSHLAIEPGGSRQLRCRTHVERRAYALFSVVYSKNIFTNDLGLL